MTGHITMSRPRVHKTWVCHVLSTVQALVKTVWSLTRIKIRVSSRSIVRIIVLYITTELSLDMFTKRSLNLLFSWSICSSCNLNDCISFSITIPKMLQTVWHRARCLSRKWIFFGPPIKKSSTFCLRLADDKCVLQMARMKQVQRKPNHLAPKGNTIVNISKTFKALHKLQLQSKVTGGIKEPRNWRPTSSALLEIRRYQRTTNLLIPKLSFQRIVKSLTNERFEGIRFQTSALHALQVFDLNCSTYFIVLWIGHKL